ncbi:hypothetical protein JHK87_044569 [Glycine soja]|nr:hypothetical protein JHK87_044569 [Glycine soja]
MRFAKILSSFTLLFIGYTLVNGSTPKALNDVLNSVSEYESVLSVFESKMNKLHTTHSWDFLGLETISKNNPKALDTASNVIVGEYLLKLNENC